MSGREKCITVKVKSEKDALQLYNLFTRTGKYSYDMTMFAMVYMHTNGMPKVLEVWETFDSTIGNIVSVIEIENLD